MTKRKFIFLIDLRPEIRTYLQSEFETRGFNCIVTKNPDEVSQACLQAGRAALIFGHTQDAIAYLTKNRETFRELKFWPYLLTSSPVLMTKELSKILPELKFLLFTQDEMGKMIDHIKDNFETGEMEGNGHATSGTH